MAKFGWISRVDGIDMVYITPAMIGYSFPANNTRGTLGCGRVPRDRLDIPDVMTSIQSNLNVNIFGVGALYFR